MDLIYMNPSKEDIGVLKDYTLDMAFGSDENNFECTVSAFNNVCEAGFYLYAEGTEYGGIIDSINVDTESETVIYKGRTWHGILDSKIFEPDAGNDYLVVKGEANTVLSTLISRMGLGNMFKVSSEASGINISYKMNRYVSGYIGILRMLKASGAKLNVIFKNGFVELSAEPFVDYSKDEQFDTDQISFTIQKNYKPINHVICLGSGDLKDRRVIHLYADGVGNISGTQTFTGVDEMCVTYDYSNAESDEELIEGGVEIIKASWASDSIEFDFESDDESFDINDVIGAIEFTTGTEVKASITKKIIKIQDYTTSISYSCESGVGTVASSGYPSSGSGGSGGVVDAYTKAETDAKLKGKSDTSHTHSQLNRNGLYNNDKYSLNITPTGEATIEYYNSATNNTSVVWGSKSHTHDDRYYTESEVNTLLNEKAELSHDHDGYYYSKAIIDAMMNSVGADIDTKADSNHTHDDRYYTETEVNNLLVAKQTVSNANNQTKLLSSTQLTTSTKRLTFAESIYNYNMLVVKITLTQGYVKTYTIPYCCYDTKCHEISIFYNLTSYYEIVEFQLKSGTTADVTIVSQGTNSSWNNGVYIELYGVGKR